MGKTHGILSLFKTWLDMTDMGIHDGLDGAKIWDFQ